MAVKWPCRKNTSSVPLNLAAQSFCSGSYRGDFQNAATFFQMVNHLYKNTSVNAKAFSGISAKFMMIAGVFRTEERRLYLAGGN